MSSLQDKELVIPDESIGKDAQSIAALQRRLAIFEHDLVKLGSQVRGYLAMLKVFVASCLPFHRNFMHARSEIVKFGIV